MQCCVLTGTAAHQASAFASNALAAAVLAFVCSVPIQTVPMIMMNKCEI